MLLDEIINNKKQEIIQDVRAFSLDKIKSVIRDIEPPRNFTGSFENSDEITIIAEIKKASPVKGLLSTTFNPEMLASSYQSGGAGAISVLTDKCYFQGNNSYIDIVRKTVNLPVMRKDFIIDQYQVYESRAIGADAILLIASILHERTLKELLTITRSLGMEALVEVHDLSELEKALRVGAKIVGINNRNLKTFSVNLETSLEMSKHVPDGVILISESGIRTRDDIVRLIEARFNGALIGESLVKRSDPANKIKELLGEKELRNRTA